MTETWAEYLARYRANAEIAASPTLSNDEVYAHMLKLNARLHGTSLHYESIGDDDNGAAVWRLGNSILLQDISVQLAALVAAGTITIVPGAKAAYSVNPSIRK